MKEETVNLGKGILLLSAPFLNDIFKRSVILLTEHNEEGTVGFIVNKLSDYRLNDAIEDFPEFDAPLFIGGPVQQNMLNFIHKNPDIPGSVEVIDGVLWGGDFEFLKDFVRSGSANPDDFRFILGYSGWGPGQLAGELQQNSWYLSRSTEELIFPDDTSELWGKALRKLGSKYAFISIFPEDPSVN